MISIKSFIMIATYEFLAYALDWFSMVFSRCSFWKPTKLLLKLLVQELFLLWCPFLFCFKSSYNS